MFCSNPEDFGIEGGEKDHIFDSLKNITKLPSSPPKGDDRLDDSAVQTVGSRTTGEGKIQEENLGEKPPWIVLVNVVQLSSSCFLLSFADSLAFFQISRLRIGQKVLRLLPLSIGFCRRHHSKKWTSRLRGRLLRPVGF